MSIRKSIYIRYIAIIVICVFLSQQIAWAYPEAPRNNPNTLAVESIFQTRPMVQDGTLRQQIIPTAIDLQCAVLNIAEYIYSVADTFEPFEHVERVIGRNSGTSLTGIGIDHIMPLSALNEALKNGWDKAIVPRTWDQYNDPLVILHKSHDGIYRILQVAKKNTPACNLLKGEEWSLPEVYSDQYDVRERFVNASRTGPGEVKVAQVDPWYLDPVFKENNVVPSYTVDTRKGPDERPNGKVPMPLLLEVPHIYPGLSGELRKSGLGDADITFHLMFIRPRDDTPRRFLNLNDPDTPVLFDDPFLYEMIRRFNVNRHISLHLGYAMTDYEAVYKDHDMATSLSEEETFRGIVDNVNLLKRKMAEHGLDNEILLENCDYFQGNEYVCRHDFIRRVVDETDCGYLIDLGHAAATSLKADEAVKGAGVSTPVEYLSKIIDKDTVERLKEVHISIPYFDRKTGAYEHGGEWGRPAINFCEDEAASPGVARVKELLDYVLTLREENGVTTDLVINFETPCDRAEEDVKALADFLRGRSDPQAHAGPTSPGMAPSGAPNSAGPVSPAAGIDENKIAEAYSLYEGEYNYGRAHAMREERIASLLAGELGMAEYDTFRLRQAVALHDSFAPVRPVNKEIADRGKACLRDNAELLKQYGISFIPGFTSDLDDFTQTVPRNSRDVSEYERYVRMFENEDVFTDDAEDYIKSCFQGAASLAKIDPGTISRSQYISILFHHNIAELQGYLSADERKAEEWSEEEKEETLLLSSVLVASDIIENGINRFKKMALRNTSDIETPEETMVWLRSSGIPSKQLGNILKAFEVVSATDDYSAIVQSASTLSRWEEEYLERGNAGSDPGIPDADEATLSYMNGIGAELYKGMMEDLTSIKGVLGVIEEYDIPDDGYQKHLRIIKAAYRSVISLFHRHILTQQEVGALAEAQPHMNRKALIAFYKGLSHDLSTLIVPLGVFIDTMSPTDEDNQENIDFMKQIIDIIRDDLDRNRGLKRIVFRRSGNELDFFNSSIPEGGVAGVDYPKPEAADPGDAGTSFLTSENISGDTSPFIPDASLKKIGMVTLIDPERSEEDVRDSVKLSVGTMEGDVEDELGMPVDDIAEAIARRGTDYTATRAFTEGSYRDAPVREQIEYLGRDMAERIIRKIDEGNRTFTVYGIGMGENPMELYYFMNRFADVLEGMDEDPGEWSLNVCGIDATEGAVVSAVNLFNIDWVKFRLHGEKISSKGLINTHIFKVNVFDKIGLDGAFERASAEGSPVPSADYILFRHVLYLTDRVEKNIGPRIIDDDYPQRLPVEFILTRMAIENIFSLCRGEDTPTVFVVEPSKNVDLADMNKEANFVKYPVFAPPGSYIPRASRGIGVLEVREPEGMGKTVEDFHGGIQRNAVTDAPIVDKDQTPPAGMIPWLSDHLIERGIDLKHQAWIEQLFFGALSVALSFVPGLGAAGSVSVTWALFVSLHLTRSKYLPNPPPAWGVLEIVFLNVIASIGFSVYVEALGLTAAIGLTGAFYSLVTLYHHLTNRPFINLIGPDIVKGNLSRYSLPGPADISAYDKLKAMTEPEVRSYLSQAGFIVKSDIHTHSIILLPVDSEDDYVIKIRNVYRDPNNSFSHYSRYQNMGIDAIADGFVLDDITLDIMDHDIHCESIVVQEKVDVLSELIKADVDRGAGDTPLMALKLRAFMDVHLELARNGFLDKLFTTGHFDDARPRRYLTNIGYSRRKRRWVHLDLADIAARSELSEEMRTPDVFWKSAQNIADWFPYEGGPARIFNEEVLSRLPELERSYVLPPDAFTDRGASDGPGAVSALGGPAPDINSVAERLENDIDNIMDGADEFRKKHVRAVIELYKAFVLRDYEKIYAAISHPVVLSKTPDKAEYFRLLDEVHKIYESLDQKDKNVLLFGTLLHDIGYTVTDSGTAHCDEGRCLAAPLLARYGITDHSIVSGVEQIIQGHQYFPDIGVDWLPDEFRARPESEKKQLFIVTIMDSAGKLKRPHISGDTSYANDNILSTQLLREYIEVFTSIDDMTDAEFLALRLKYGGIKRPFQISRDGLELNEHEAAFLVDMAEHDQTLSVPWTHNIRNYVFPLFMVLKQLGGDDYIHKLYKLKKLFACISLVYMERTGYQGTVDLVARGGDFSDEFFAGILDGLDTLFAADPEDISVDKIKDIFYGPMENPHKVFGLWAEVSDGKLTIGRPSNMVPVFLRYVGSFLVRVFTPTNTGFMRSMLMTDKIAGLTGISEGKGKGLNDTKSGQRPQLKPWERKLGMAAGAMIGSVFFGFSAKGMFAATVISALFMFIGWMVHESGHLLGKDLGGSDLWELTGGPIASLILSGITAVLLVLSVIEVIPYAEFWGVPFAVFPAIALANFIIHTLADDMILIDGPRKIDISKGATGDDIYEYVRSINDSFQKALYITGKEKVTNDKGEDVEINTYPLVCDISAVMLKKILRRKFGHLIKRIDVVTGSTSELYLSPGDTVRTHVWLEIETYEGRYYYLSLSDGGLDKGAFEEKYKEGEYEIYEPFSRRKVQGREVSGDYIAWLMSEEKDKPVFSEILDPLSFRTDYMRRHKLVEIVRGRAAEAYYAGISEDSVIKVFDELENTPYVTPSEDEADPFKWEWDSMDLISKFKVLDSVRSVRPELAERFFNWLGTVISEEKDPVVRESAKRTYRGLRSGIEETAKTLVAEKDMGDYTEVNISVFPDILSSGKYAEQYNECWEGLVKACEDRGYSPSDVMSENVLMGAVNNEEFFLRGKTIGVVRELKYAHTGRAPPVSFIGQLPENYGQVAVEYTLIVPKNDRVKITRKAKRVMYRDKPYWAQYVVIEDGHTKQVRVDGITVSDNETDIRLQSEGAFEIMEAVLTDEGMQFSDVVRQWNYLERIVDHEEDGRQRYRIFNDVRSEYYDKADFDESGYPAATGIGTSNGGVVLGFIAVIPADPDRKDEVNIIPIDNPLQISAHKYSSEVQSGSTPKFERAKAVVAGDKVRLYVSGTAGIRGEIALNPGDVEQQTRMTIDNIEVLIGRDNLMDHGINSGATLEDISIYRVYVKHEKDMNRVRKICFERFGTDIPVQFVVADVCRPDLLVEIEAIATVDAGKDVLSDIDIISERIADKILAMAAKGTLTSLDLNDLIWALDKDDMPRDDLGRYRAFTNEEIYRVLEVLDRRLRDHGIEIGKVLRRHKPDKVPLDFFREQLLDHGRTMYLDLYSQKVLINNLEKYFRVMNRRQNEQRLVFLSRDALSGQEFFQYFSAITGMENATFSVYQPGMSNTAIVSDYTPRERIEMVQKATDNAKARAIQKMISEKRIPRKAGSDFYEDFHPQIYADIADEFARCMAEQWEEDPVLKDEAKILFENMKRAGIIGRGDVVFCDMAATGKTVLYLKTVFEYFSEEEKLGPDSASVFVGYSHDRKLCLPELRMFDRTLAMSPRPFKDQDWPFFNHGTDNEGVPVFRLTEKRESYLVHAYRSMLLYNAALDIIDTSEVEYEPANRSVGRAAMRDERDYLERSAISVRSYSHGQATNILESLDGLTWNLTPLPGDGEDITAVYERLKDLSGRMNKLYREVYRTTKVDGRLPTRKEASVWILEQQRAWRYLGNIIKAVDELLEDSTRKDHIVRELETARAIIASRIDFARARPGTDIIDLAELVANNIPETEGNTELVSVRSKVHIFGLDTPDMTTKGDPISLVNAVANVVDNARDFAGKAYEDRGQETSGDVKDSLEPPTVNVRLNRANGYNEIVIEDNGPGMDRETLDNIFAFNWTSRGESDGTGLGLAESRKIIEDHAGSIVVDSEPGVGTVFIIRLPFSPGRPVPGKVGQYPIDKEKDELERTVKVIEATINSRRSSLVEYGNIIIEYLARKNRFAGFSDGKKIERNMVASQIRFRLEQVLRVLEDEAPETLPAGIVEAKTFISAELHTLEADSVSASLLSLSMLNRDSGRDLVLALDTNWIPGYVKGALQHEEISDLVRILSSLDVILKGMDIENVSMVIREKGESPKAWALRVKEANKYSDDYSNVILFGEKDSYEYFNDVVLSGTDPGKRAFTASVDTNILDGLYAEHGETLDEQLPVCILDMLSVTLELALMEKDVEPDLSGIPFIVEGSYDKRLRRIMYLPTSEPLKYGLFEEYYRIRCEALMAV